MKRRLIIAAVFLLAGAVVNVAVAWGCALWSPTTPFPEMIVAPASALVYPRPVPANWPPPFQYQRSGSFGCSFVGAAAHVEPGQISEYSHVRSVGQSVIQYGLPFRALEHEMRLYMLSPPSGPPLDHPIEFVGDVGQVPLALVPSEHRLRRLPLRPIWPGSAVNTIFYAAVLWLLIPGPFVLRRFIRVKRGLCPTCAYPTGESAVCSECGEALPGRREAAT